MSEEEKDSMDFHREYIEKLEATIDILRERLRNYEVRSIIHEGLVTATADKSILN